MSYEMFWRDMYPVALFVFLGMSLALFAFIVGYLIEVLPRVTDFVKRFIRKALGQNERS